MAKRKVLGVLGHVWVFLNAVPSDDRSTLSGGCWGLRPEVQASLVVVPQLAAQGNLGSFLLATNPSLGWHGPGAPQGEPYTLYLIPG